MKFYRSGWSFLLIVLFILNITPQKHNAHLHIGQMMAINITKLQAAKLPFTTPAIAAKKQFG
jgi:hypothetical protein